MKKSLLMLCVAAALCCPSPAAAVSGWQIEEVDADFPEERVQYFYAEGSVRIANFIEGLDFLVDLEKGQAFIIAPGEGLYAGGTVNEVSGFVTGHMEARQKVQGTDEEKNPAAALISDMRLERVPAESRHAGFAAEEYRVFLGELLVEEVWIAPEIDAVTAGEGGDLFSILEVMTGGAGGENDDFPPVYEKEAVYRDLLRSGYPVRRVWHYLDVETSSEVVRAERRNLPDALFAVPPDFEKTGYLKLISGKK